MTDEAFMHAFEAGAIEGGSFRHEDHVRLAWIYLRNHPLLDAIDRVTTGLKRFTTAKGVPARYHATITWASVLLIHERIRRMAQDHTWPEFAAENPDLLDRSDNILKRYYTRETLDSDLARSTFVLPEMALRGQSLAGTPRGLRASVSSIH